MDHRGVVHHEPAAGALKALADPLTYWQNKRVRAGGDAGRRVQPTSPQPAAKGVRR